MFHIGDMQNEIDRLGDTAFNLYIERCLRVSSTVEDNDAISALIGHMRIGCVDFAVACDAAANESLPPEVRLMAWRQSQTNPDSLVETLILECIASEEYHPMACAAQALSSPPVDIPTIMRLLSSPLLPEERALKVMDYLLREWNSDRISALLDAEGLSEAKRERALLYAANADDVSAFDILLDQMETMSAEMVASTVCLFGHVLERQRVERAVTAIVGRQWTGKERVSIAGAFVTGLTSRMKMFGMRSGTLDPIPPHPGRTVPYELLKKWTQFDDYDTRDLLRLLLSAVQLGVPDTARALRLAFNKFTSCPFEDEHPDSSLAGWALESMHAHGEALALEDLEQFALSATYNFASTVVRLIALGGTQAEADSLIRLYEARRSETLRSVIVDLLEPLAGRLGLRVTQNDNRLSAVAI